MKQLDVCISYSDNQENVVCPNYYHSVFGLELPLQDQLKEIYRVSSTAGKAGEEGLFLKLAEKAGNIYIFHLSQLEKLDFFS